MFWCVFFGCVQFVRGFLFGFFQVMWLTLCTALVGYFPDGRLKQWLNRKVSFMCFAILSSSISSVVIYHNPENRPKNGICVANHTSPIDVLILMCDNCYSLVGPHHSTLDSISIFYMFCYLTVEGYEATSME